MRDSMRARDERRTQTLRMAMSAAHNRQIELGRSLADEDYVEILSRQLKQRRESVEAFRAGGRDAMAADELEQLVRAAIAETGAASPADLGKVMGKVVPHTKGRADGKAVSDLVRRLLSD